MADGVGGTLAELCARADALVPSLRARAATAERLRRIPDETIQEFKHAGFFRVFVPKRYGGLELDYGPTQIELSSRLGRGCGSSAWVQCVVAVHAWILAMLPEVAQEAVWSSGPDTLLTTAISPLDGTIRRVEGVTLAKAIHPELRGRSFRVGHMGVCGPAEILTTLGAIERGLHRLGQPVDFGASLAAAQRVLAEPPTEVHSGAAELVLRR